VPVPVKDKAEKHANDDFNALPEGKELTEWNIYSPLWAQVQVEKGSGGSKTLVMQDSDPFDYAKAERVIPPTKRLIAEFSIVPKQNDHGLLDIEFLDAKGTPGIRLSLDSAGVFRTKAGYRNKNLMQYKSGERLDVKVQINTATRLYSVSVNGKNLGNNILFAPLESVSRIVFRTGDTRRFPNADTPTDQMYDLPDAGRKDKEAVFNINYLTSRPF
jgi:hypothetical protein